MTEGIGTSYAGRSVRICPDGRVSNALRFMKVALGGSRSEGRLVRRMAVLPIFIVVVVGCSIVSAGTAQARDVSQSAFGTSSPDSLAVTRLASSLSVANTDAPSVTQGTRPHWLLFLRVIRTPDR